MYQQEEAAAVKQNAEHTERERKILWHNYPPSIICVYMRTFAMGEPGNEFNASAKCVWYVYAIEWSAGLHHIAIARLKICWLPERISHY